jgi:DMSO/TMAO reductase YedYZ molybdopterin-dependent catalytic subunit
MRHCRERPMQENRPRLPRTALIAGIALLLALPLLTACSADQSSSEEEPDEAQTYSSQATGLEAVEVQEYEGKDLSSIEDFRENSIKGPQTVDVGSYTLSVKGLVDQPLELSYEEVIASADPYTKAITLNCVEGWSVDILWEGLLVTDILEQAGADPDASVVIFRAVDGYSTSLPMEYLRSRDILMAYRMNGVDLPPERGFPFQLVAERKWGYKWIKWIEEIEVSNDKEFRGYWEQRGYSNDGDLGGDYRE